MDKNLLGLNDKFVMIVGGNGFIGKELVKNYYNLGSKVLVLDKKIPKNSNIKNIFYKKFDLKKTIQFKSFFEKNC